jgi:hypothetical protein
MYIMRRIVPDKKDRKERKFHDSDKAVESSVSFKVASGYFEKKLESSGSLLIGARYVHIEIGSVGYICR